MCDSGLMSVCLFWGRASLCSPVRPGTHRDQLASAFWELGVKAVCHYAWPRFNVFVRWSVSDRKFYIQSLNDFNIKNSFHIAGMEWGCVLTLMGWDGGWRDGLERDSGTYTTLVGKQLSLTLSSQRPDFCGLHGTLHSCVRTYMQKHIYVYIYIIKHKIKLAEGTGS